MFTLRPRARRLVAQWLAAWLFALASGLVNACVVMPGLHAVKAAAPAHAPEHGAVCCGDDIDGDDDGGWVFGPCGKFCADKSSGVPAAKPAFDYWPLLGLALAPAWAADSAGPVPQWRQRPDGAPPRWARLPVHIAYLRLTL